MTLGMNIRTILEENSGTGLYTLDLSDASCTTIKRALINGKGEIVLQPANYEIGSSSYNDETNYILKNGDTYQSIDSNGIKNIDGKDYSDISCFNHGYATVTLKSDSKNGVIDQSGKLLFKDTTGKYKKFIYIADGLFSAEIGDNTYAIVNAKGEPLTTDTYEWILGASDNYIEVTKKGKFGILDVSGKEIIPFIYDNVGYFKEGLAYVCKDNKWGFVDETGKEKISPQFDYAIGFDHGLAAVSLNEKWGLIDKEAKTVLPIAYDYIPQYKNGNFIAYKENKTDIIDTTGKVIQTKEYSYINVDESGNISVGKKIKDKTVYAYLDSNENMLTGYKEFDINPMNDTFYIGTHSGDYPQGIAPPHDYERKIAIFDSKGNNLTGFKYTNPGEYNDKFFVVYKDYFGGVGLVNQYGAEVIPTQCESIFLTKEGYAIIEVRDAETGENVRVGYFKIPDSFSEIKATKPITIYLNGVELYLDSEPTVKNQRVMVPLRKIFESLGSDVQWDNTNKTIIANRDNKKIQLQIGSTNAEVDGEKVNLEEAPYIQDDKTLVPLRFVAESLGADVQWDNDLRRVLINSTN